MIDKSEISKFILGCDLEHIQESVIIAPCWYPDSVGINDTELVSDRSCKIWNCKLDEQLFTYIITGVGACNCADTVMSLERTACKKILFIGSAGTIDKNISIGDIVFPYSFIVCEGASRYLCQDLWTDTFGCELSISKQSCIELLRDIDMPAKHLGITCHSGRAISVESIFSQFAYIHKFIDMGCQYIDMESSAFITATKRTGIKGIVCFCISDNVTRNQSLVTISNDMLCFRKEIRRKIMPIIIKEFITKI